MKITYNKNPLKTTIELDEHEKKELWYKIKLSEYEDIIFEAHFYLGEKYFDVARVQGVVTPDKVRVVDKRVAELFEYYIAALVEGHGGDCTCIPCTCDKCMVEEMIGIDTIKGLNKHAGYRISQAFYKEKTLDEAIEYLNANIVSTKDIEWDNFSQEDFDSHIPRWTEEGTLALTWLRNYRATHFTEFNWKQHEHELKLT